MDIVDSGLDLVDNIMPGVIGYFSGIVTKSKKKLEEFKSLGLRVKFCYFLFTFLYLLFILVIQGKNVIESSIYIKLISALFNVSVLAYGSLKSFY
tara:strand:+ start:123 stop:407 length:285 start_codon:yes stop_codon:yes gene_type:complete